MKSVVQAGRICVNGLTHNLIGPTTVIAKAVRASLDITLGELCSFAVIQGLDTGEDVNVFFKEIGELGQQATSLGGGDVFPGTVEGLASGLDSDIDIFFGSFVDTGNDFFVVRVDGLEGLAVDTFDELAIDEPYNRRLASLHKKEEREHTSQEAAHI